MKNIWTKNRQTERFCRGNTSARRSLIETEKRTETRTRNNYNMMQRKLFEVDIFYVSVEKMIGI